MNEDVLKLSTDSFLPLRDVVFQTLREAILTGTIQPGERLPEITLSKRMGVSRTPLREALRMLEQEGLVIMYPRRGACVANISEKTLRDVLEVRRVLEELSVELASKHCDENNLRELNLANIEMEKAIRLKDIRMIAQKDEEFHHRIYEMADNQKLTLMINNLREQMFRYRLEYVKDEPMRYTVLTEHKEIIRALEAGDVELAKLAMGNHIRNQEITVTHNITK